MYPSSKSKEERIADVGFDYGAQELLPVKACNLSGAGRMITLTHRDRYGYPAKASLCADSGLVFLDPVMTREGYAEFYKGTYRPLVSAYHNRLIDARNIQQEQKAYAAELIDFLKTSIGPKEVRKVLDVGGSTGVVSREVVAAFGCEATILDPAPDELACAEEMGMGVLAGFIEDIEIEPESYDLILICQSIDHLLDVDSALARIREALTDEGWFFVDIVDFRAAYLRNRSVEEAVKIDHPYYFCMETMQAYLDKHGFEVMRVNFAADHLHIGFLCRKAEPKQNYLPPRQWIDSLVAEIRQIQNPPNPPNPPNDSPPVRKD